MKWEKYTIDTTTAAEDFISMALSELGIEGIEIENHVPLTREETGEMFIDFPPELPPDDGKSMISFYLEAGEDHSGKLAQVRAELEGLRSIVDIGSGAITASQTEDIDWVNNWKQFFKSFYIDDILIKPTWEPLREEDRDKFLIEIDPGVSFGTGKHETTQLCIRQLRKYLHMNDRVLDVGCGSGILSIAALKLGAGNVIGTDIDEACITSAYDNLELNHKKRGKADFYAGNLIEDAALGKRIGMGTFHVIVANILADVIIPLAPVAYEGLIQGGVFITSGIIDFKEQEVRAAVEAAGFTILEVNHQGEWVNITARKL